MLVRQRTYVCSLQSPWRRGGTRDAGNDQINVTVANEAAPVPWRSASSVLTSCRRRPLMRGETHAHKHTHTRMHGEENTLVCVTHGCSRYGCHVAHAARLTFPTHVQHASRRSPRRSPWKPPSLDVAEEAAPTSYGQRGNLADADRF